MRDFIMGRHFGGRRRSAGGGSVVTAPTASGGIADQSWVEDSAITPLDVSADFSGTAPITYALAPGSASLPAGLSLSSAGVISGTPTTPAAQVNIVVRGTNSAGHADTAFGVTISAVPSYDYLVTSKAEWNTVMGYGSATLSGKTIAISGTIADNLEMTGISPAEALTIIGIDSAANVESFSLKTGTGNIVFQDLTIQMRGWPANRLYLIYREGTLGAVTYRRVKFRHGSNAALEPFATASPPESQPTANNITATSSSTATALDWGDHALGTASSWVTVINDGAETIYFAIGGSGVTATLGSTAVASGADLRVTNLTPDSDTHIALITASGTSAVNARTEQGMINFCAKAFQSDGGATQTGEVLFLDCEFEDLFDALKGLSAGDTLFRVDRCTFKRVYHDLIALWKSGSDVPYYATRIHAELPFSNPTHAQNPHPDLFQLYGNVSTPSAANKISNNFVAGAVLYTGLTINQVYPQGVFCNALQTGAANPAYENMYVIACLFPSMNVSALAISEPGGPIGSTYVHGVTVAPYSFAQAARIRLDNVLPNQKSQIYVGASVASTIDGTGASGENIRTKDAWAYGVGITPSDAFPNIANRATATTPALMRAAMTPAAGHTDKGFEAGYALIDWETDDPAQAIKWASLPCGVVWGDLVDQAPSTAIETWPQKFMGADPLDTTTTYPVVPGAGTEVQILQADAATVVTAWTSSSTTMKAGECIQLRRTSSASELTTVQATATLKGQTISANIRTAAVLADPITMSGAFFHDPSNLPASTTRLEWEAKLSFGSASTSNEKIFAQEGGTEFYRDTNGNWRLVVRDSAYATIASETLDFGPTVDVPVLLYLDVDLDAETYEVTANGDTIMSGATSGGTGAKISRPTAEASNGRQAQFNRRDSVQHSVFGVGTVIESKVTRSDEEVTVAFPGVGVKKLMASMADLKKL